MIAVCIPSRALIQSRTMESVLDNLEGHDYRFCFAHGLPIPDCHNEVVETALKLKPDYIWLLEDDQLIPEGHLDEMMRELEDAEAIVSDYPVGSGGTQHCVQITNGQFVWAGLGCVLLRPSVFDKLDRPYFRTDTSYQVEGNQVIEVRPMGSHGLHDVDFWQRLMKAGITPKITRKSVGHIHMLSPDLPRLGNDTANQYKIEVWF